MDSTMSNYRRVAVLALAWPLLLAAFASAGQVYRSPYAVVASPDGKAIYVSDRTANCVVALDPAKGAKTAEWPVEGEPTGLALSPDGKTLFVSLYKANEVAAIATDSGKVLKRIGVGARPVGMAVAPKLNRLFVCNSGAATVSMIDLGELAEKWRVQLVREPMFAAVTPDEATVVVTNALALGPATESTTSASLSLFDAKEGKTGATIPLPGGSTNCRVVALSPDGKWAYFVHSVSRFQVPTTQLERGWMNTSAVSIVDLAKRELYATCLLDSIDLGAADPFGLALSPDGKTLWISLSGTHEIARLQAASLVEMLSGKVPDKYAQPIGTANTNPWADIKADPQKRAGLVNDLMALYFADLIERFPAGGQGPRCIALSSDGQKLFVPNYFSGTVTALDTATGKVAQTTPVGPQPEPDIVRKGELVFHDAILCFQHWQSCSTCHPNGARMDGLRWDLLNDGIGNHKKTRSLVYAHRQKPAMAMGVRDSAEAGVRAGFKFILFAVVPEETAASVDAYLKSLEPDPNPNLEGGKLSQAAERGRALFEGKAKCAECHKGPLYTDEKGYDVGTAGPYEPKDMKLFTPRLNELYRNAPYLHDGRTANLKDVLTTYNKENKHGATSGLSPQELDDLVAYLKSL